MGLDATITYLDGTRFRVASRGHELTCDQPVENGGTDSGMTPPELLLGSLGSCAAYYVVEYLRTRSMPVAGVTVTVSAQKGEKPARVAEFRIRLNVPGLEDQRHRDGVLRAAKTCLIHNTLLHTPRIDLDLTSENAQVDPSQSELAGKN